MMRSVDSDDDFATGRERPAHAEVMAHRRSIDRARAVAARGAVPATPRDVSLVERLPDVEVSSYSPAHAAACRTWLDVWKQAYRAAHGTGDGVSSAGLAIERAGTLPESVLGGEVVYLDGRLTAFAFGGAIRPGLACSFERKCNTVVRGLSYFRFRSFLQSLREFAFVNDGSDPGRTGLRQLKESFHPVALHMEYRGLRRAG